jgi:hypothetical protein
VKDSSSINPESVIVTTEHFAKLSENYDLYFFRLKVSFIGMKLPIAFVQARFVLSLEVYGLISLLSKHFVALLLSSQPKSSTLHDFWINYFKFPHFFLNEEKNSQHRICINQ